MRALLLAVTAMTVLVALSNVSRHVAEYDVTAKRWVEALSNTNDLVSVNTYVHVDVFSARRLVQ